MRGEHLVRPASPADSETVERLLRRFYDEEHVEYEPARLARRVREFLGRDRGVVLLAEPEGEAAGLALVSLSYGVEFGERAELEDLYVLPEWRGRGWAGSLLRGAELWCRERGVETITLVVTAEGEAAHGLSGFYEKHGFRRTGRAVLLRGIE